MRELDAFAEFEKYVDIGGLDKSVDLKLDRKIVFFKPKSIYPVHNIKAKYDKRSRDPSPLRITRSRFGAIRMS